MNQILLPSQRPVTPVRTAAPPVRDFRVFRAVAGAAPALPPLSLLVAEDQAPNRYLIECLLEDLPVTPQFAATGPGAREALESAAFDGALIDLRLPGLGGLDLVRALRPACPNLPLVACSGSCGPDDLRACREAGFDGALPKPVRRDALVACLAWIAHMRA